MLPANYFAWYVDGSGGRTTQVDLLKYTVIEPQLSLADINSAIARGVPARLHVRSSGTHLSSIIQQISKDSGRLKEKIVFGRNTFEPIDEDDLAGCIFAGFALEDLIIRTNPWIDRYGELSSDGIAMSPDGVAFNCKRHLLSPHQQVTALVEIKTTWKSSRHPIEERVSWMQQMKSYCRALDTRHAILVVFFCVGDYTFGNGGGPHLRQYHLEFTNWEIESCWSEILRKRDQMNL